MKYKVIAKILDGVIAVSKSQIICFSENSLRDDNGEDALYYLDGKYYNIPIGRILTDKNCGSADVYWSYTKKQWNAMNDAFQKEQKL